MPGIRRSPPFAATGSGRGCLRFGAFCRESLRGVRVQDRGGSNVAIGSIAKSAQLLAVVDAKPAHESGASVFAPRNDSWERGHAEPIVVRFLRSLQVFLRSARLYRKNHPRLLENLETADRNLRAALETLGAVAFGVERGSIYVPKLGEMALADPHEEFNALAEGLTHVGITSIIFHPKTNQGELDTLVHLINNTLLRSERRSGEITGTPAGATGSHGGSKRPPEHNVAGIAVNTRIERKVDSVLASLIPAMVAYGGASKQESSHSGRLPVLAPTLKELAPALRRLARLTPPLEIASGTGLQEAARALHATLAAAKRETVRLLVSAISNEAPREGEHPQPYLIRRSESLIFQFIHQEFLAWRLKPPQVRVLFDRLRDVLWASGGDTGPHSSPH